MNILVKSAVAGALALGATGAYAMGVPNTNSSDLVLVVENTTTNATYAFDTGISIDSVLPTAGIVKGTSLGTTIPGVSQTFTAAQLTGLSAFLATSPASGDSWTLEAGQYNGGGTANSNNGNSNAVGAAKMIFTSSGGTINNGVVSGFVLANLVAFENGITTDVTAGGLLNGLTTATNVSGSGLYPGPAQQKYGVVGAPDMSPVGVPAQLFGFTGSATTGALTSYILGSATWAADGSLTITGNGTSAPVPLPAAVWLFGSGLMGLVGVSRRRKAAV
jgi:hypothetical protein